MTCQYDYHHTIYDLATIYDLCMSRPFAPCISLPPPRDTVSPWCVSLSNSIRGLRALWVVHVCPYFQCHPASRARCPHAYSPVM
ncbi:hypothetical protein VTO73DRAFT_755 [Trametes versicolor]